MFVTIVNLLAMYCCDHCDKTYKYKRNLKRHISEKHTMFFRHWKCVEKKCSGKFIRREYLLDHLTNKHKYTRSEARVAAINASRENQKESTGYYENVSSSDDDIFDILAEADELNVDQDSAIHETDTELLDNSAVDSDKSVDKGVQPEDSDGNGRVQSDNGSSYGFENAAYSPLLDTDSVFRFPCTSGVKSNKMADDTSPNFVLLQHNIQLDLYIVTFRVMTMTMLSSSGEVRIYPN